MQFDTLTRTARANAIITALGSSSVCQLFDGTMPAATTTADAGTKIVDIACPSTPFTESGGVLSLNGTWSDNSADATGLPKYYRLKTGAGVVKAQGLLGETWQASKAYLVGQQVNNGGNCYKCTTAGTSASSGGPTGTGSGITDGTAVWAYQGAAEMTIGNTNVNAGQAVSVTAFTLTEGNA